MHQRLLRLWYGDSPGVSVLQPLSWLYGAAISVRRQAYERGWVKSHGVGRPVIVVGNLTVGGTGKTPLTIWLASHLRQRGYDVGLVSRGYGREQGGLRMVTSDSSWEEVGDEPLILHRRTGCMTLVASDRVAGARALAERGAKVILADDGLQHLRMRRDCEIVVIDGARGLGNGRMLPAGPLRESGSRVRAADALVVNGGIEGEPVRGVPPKLAAAALRMRLQSAQARQVAGSRQEQPARGLSWQAGARRCRDRQSAAVLRRAARPRPRAHRAPFSRPPRAVRPPTSTSVTAWQCS